MKHGASHDHYLAVSLTWLSVIGTHGYALVYSVASRQSYDIAKILFEKILDLTGLRTVPCVLVGSKSDLAR